MPTAQENKVKADKVRRALEKEATRLKGWREGDAINALLNEAGDSTLARLFDLLVTHPTKAAALASLKEGGR